MSDNLKPMRVTKTVDPVVSTTSNTTAIPLPAQGTQYFVTNFDGARQVRWKTGRATENLDASHNTDNRRIRLGPGQTGCFTLIESHTHIWMDVATGAAIDVQVGCGEGM
jgi:hypothetical protein